MLGAASPIPYKMRFYDRTKKFRPFLIFSHVHNASAIGPLPLPESAKTLKVSQTSGPNPHPNEGRCGSQTFHFVGARGSAAHASHAPSFPLNRLT